MKKVLSAIIGTPLLLASLSSYAMTVEDKFPYVHYTERSFYDYIIPSTDKDFVKKAISSGNISRDEIKRSVNEQQKFEDWLHEKNPERYIVINVPEFKLYYFEGKELVWETKVVVGSPKKQTPLNNFEIVSLKYNPTWTPTPRMIRDNAKKSDGSWNRAWIDRLGLKVYHEGSQVSLQEASRLPLSSLTLRQPSGPNNALGNIKFETTSDQYIYLHDTNEKDFFDYKSRAYSSGCVRVQDPYKLASLLSGDSYSTVEKNISTGKMYWDKVSSTPVYFMYDLVNYNDGENSHVTIHDDVYKRL